MKADVEFARILDANCEACRGWEFSNAMQLLLLESRERTSDDSVEIESVKRLQNECKRCFE